MNATGTIITAKLVGLLVGLPAHAQAPFVDGAFTTRSADNDPDLVVVRERYDEASRRQSVYLRVHDGAADYQLFSGQVLFQGARVVRFIYAAEEMAASDAQWGLPAVDYSAGGARRGLEGEVADFVPEANGLLDHLSRGPNNSAIFWFGGFDDIDEARIIVEYPPGLNPASMTVELFNLRFPSPRGFPFSSTGGIQVGSLVDHTPDDGDYSEVFSTPPLKLRVEDLDILERELSLGQVDEGGGLAGPGQFTVDNDFGGADADQDNGFDQNGLISPIRAAGPLEHVAWEATALVGEATAHEIAPEQVRVEGVPERLPLGERASLQVFIAVPPDAPEDKYYGRIHVWEDNVTDGRRANAEPGDSVRVGLVVGSPTDGGVDLGFPDQGVDAGDMGAPGDASDGVVSGDGGDAAEAGGRRDGGDASDGGDAGDATDAGDGARRADGDVGPDLGRDLGPDATPDPGPGSPRGGAGECSHGPAEHEPPFALLLILLAPWIRRSRS